jgi:hypothetical protein
MEAKRQAIAAFDMTDDGVGTIFGYSEATAVTQTRAKSFGMMVRPEGFEPPAY